MVSQFLSFALPFRYDFNFLQEKEVEAMKQKEE
jgi:hypothetical protein